MTPKGVHDSVKRKTNDSPDEEVGRNVVPLIFARAKKNDPDYAILPSAKQFIAQPIAEVLRPTDRASNAAKRTFKAKREFSTLSLLVKQAIDFVLASIMLISLIPVFLVIALILRMGGSPVIFAHQRVGKSGQLFDCYKFRTMKVDAAEQLEKLLASDPEKRREWERTHKLEDDPRITWFGRFLRKSSLDEIPQFINVIRGDMSLVGPRPIVVDELKRYGGFVDYYLSVKPGLTGLWQVSGRNNTTYWRRVALDVAYVRKSSIWMDLAILARTGFSVFSGHGAK